MVDLKTCSVDEAIKIKNDIINNLNTYLDDLAYDEQKKCALIIYWLRDYLNYIKSEKDFKPTYRPTYKKGSIVEVNFGYRVGSEFGGRHYAIVLDKKNAKNSPIITVLPLSSIKEGKKDFRNTEVDLGTTIFEQLFNKLANFLIWLHENYQIIDWIRKNLSLFETNPDISQKIIAQLVQLAPVIRNVSNKTDLSTFLGDYATELNKFYEQTRSTRDRIERMKKGSYAIINQITTISKQRIIDPITPCSSLHDIILPELYINKIDKKIKSYFLNIN